MTPQAIVFDMDGVLTDTEVIWDEVRRGLAADEGRAWPEEATTAMMGMSTPEWSRYLVETVGLSGSPELVANRTIDAMAERYLVHLPTLPGAVEAVRRLAGRWTLGLASSSPRRLIDSSLAALGLTDSFAVTVSTEEVERGKPAPDGYLRACELLGVDPAASVAIEDSSNGLRAAAAARMKVIAVPRPEFPPAEDALALADVVVEHLDEVTVELVAGLV
ncbi:haloacid dehalogenase superfamily, subfamily IA, variant 3 with third motif having DD or ED [Raineyella antarctica]|uniref:Haloacid dehalogenase superfamily, subfamily IA, variant 3 with third motif having DD or ED n=1 Tax=Raineyella antarctica TaxID=1577474 RepID=A0A1G6GWY2_9ACTN|nr:HAD family phosphatase [Raineyella antarctica]SDB86451.1 haloacid dehalogenase superfamily, subfamily IA, variant 3 with third motif having DD or ED [Raineyella antarctica]